MSDNERMIYDYRGKSIPHKILLILLDTFEIFIPVIAFSVMFIVFVIQIFFRYFLDNPLTWPYELSVFGFIWTAILGGCFARRMGVHVVFGLVYDSLNDFWKLIFRLLANGIVFAGFVISFYPTYQYVKFMSFQKSTVLRIPFDIAFSPYIVFMVLILGHTGYDLVMDVKKLIKGEYSS